MMHLDYGLGMGGFGWFFMVIFLVLVIVGVIYLIRLIIPGTTCGTKEETALDILKKRYAKGEINKEEFEEKKKDLK